MTDSPRIRRARSLRQRSGLAEQGLWQVLRGGRIDGLKFRRQHPIGPYTVDFACDPLRLIIELDGGVHGLEDVAERDVVRQRALEDLGWTVLRFSNEQALGEQNLITAAIRHHAKLVRADPHPPTDFVGGPLPLPMGEESRRRFPSKPRPPSYRP